MKPFLLTILVIILALALLGSCMYTNLSGNASQAAVTQTNITPTLTATNGPPPIGGTHSPVLFSDLNKAVHSMETSNSFNELEHIAGPSYQVIGVDFSQENNPPALRVKTRCECAENGPCCNYTRTFVVTILALEKVYINPSFLTPEASGEIGVLEVWCYDHANLSKVVYVPWTDVKSFLINNIDGFQLWAKATPSPP